VTLHILVLPIHGYRVAWTLTGWLGPVPQIDTWARGRTPATLRGMTALRSKTTVLPPNYRWNFILLSISSVSFGVMMAFVSISTVTPALVSRLTDSALLIGLVGTVFRLGWLLPQLAVAHLIQGKLRKKPYLYPGIVGRIVAGLLVPVALVLGLVRYPGAMLAVIFAYLGLFAASDSAVAVPWLDILARAVPVERRGRLFGLSQVISRLIGIGVGVAVGRIIGSPGLPFPMDYALLFALGAVALLPSGIGLWLLREPPPSPAPERTSRLQGSPLKLVGSDPDFQRLIVCRMLVGLSGLASAFYMVHATAVGRLPENVVGQFVVAQTVGGLIGSLAFGWLSERRGPLWVIRVGSLTAAIGPLFALIANAAPGAQTVWAYSVVFFSLGTLDAVWIQGFSNYLLEIAPGDLRPLYVGASNTLLSLVALSPILGGWILTSTSYAVLFIVTAVALCAAFVVSLKMRSTYKTTVFGLE